MKQYAISMDESVMERFDNVIGDVTRSAYIRRLVVNELDTLERTNTSISNTNTE